MLRRLAQEMEPAAATRWQAGPIVGGATASGRPGRAIHDPADLRRIVGEVIESGASDVDHALSKAAAAARGWDGTPAEERATILERAADLYETHRGDLMTLIVREGGRTIPDALSEVREAVDFLRYYAAHAREQFGRAIELPGPTGGATSCSSTAAACLPVSRRGTSRWRSSRGRSSRRWPPAMP